MQRERFEVGLLLGTSPVTPSEEHNYYFDERIAATAALYHHGKIRQIIASGGDYSNNGGCNELIAMRDALMKLGVPDSVVSLDYRGTRTLQSIVRVKDLGNISKRVRRGIRFVWIEGAAKMSISRVGQYCGLGASAA